MAEVLPASAHSGRSAMAAMGCLVAFALVPPVGPAAAAAPAMAFSAAVGLGADSDDDARSADAGSDTESTRPSGPPDDITPDPPPGDGTDRREPADAVEETVPPAATDHRGSADPVPPDPIVAADIEIDAGRVAVPLEVDWRSGWFGRHGRDRTAVTITVLTADDSLELLEARVRRGAQARDDRFTVRLPASATDDVRTASRVFITTTQSFDGADDGDRLYERNLVDTRVLRVDEPQPVGARAWGRSLALATSDGWTTRDCGAELFRPGADLSSCRITGVWLPDTKLSRIDLHRATIRTSNFSGSDLANAKLTRTTVSGTRFDRADMRSSVLFRAGIGSLSVMIDTDLRGANLEEASITWTSLAGANLIQANTKNWYLQAVSLSHTWITPDWRCAWYAIDGCPRG